MTTSQTSPAPQAKTRKRRNAYRDLAIEFYARNSSSVLAITHQHWPNQPWTSQPELARLLSDEIGWEVDYRSLSRQLRRVHRFDHAVRERIFQLISDDALCGRWNSSNHENVVPLRRNSD